nr:MAG TPA: hypothetical protein [Caudoviricetes sp.]
MAPKLHTESLPQRHGRIIPTLNIRRRGILPRRIF